MQWHQLPILSHFVSYWPNHRLKYVLLLHEPRILSVRVTKQLGERLAAAMKTQGEIEAAICEGMSRFEQEYMGRGPKDIHAHLIGDLLVVRLQGVLTAAEQHLVTTLPVEKGRDLLKQVRTQLIEIARPALEALVQDITGIKPRSLHHDISTLTGEEVVIFTLAEAPQFPRDQKEVIRRCRRHLREAKCRAPFREEYSCPPTSPISTTRGQPHGRGGR